MEKSNCNLFPNKFVSRRSDAPCRGRDGPQPRAIITRRDDARRASRPGLPHHPREAPDSYHLYNRRVRAIPGVQLTNALRSPAKNFTGCSGGTPDKHLTGTTFAGTPANPMTSSSIPRPIPQKTPAPQQKFVVGSKPSRALTPQLLSSTSRRTSAAAATARCGALGTARQASASRSRRPLSLS